MPQQLATSVELNRPVVQLIERCAHSNVVQRLYKRLEGYGVFNVLLVEVRVYEEGVVAGGLDQRVLVGGCEFDECGERGSVVDGVVLRLYVDEIVGHGRVELDADHFWSEG